MESRVSAEAEAGKEVWEGAVSVEMDLMLLGILQTWMWRVGNYGLPDI